MRALITGMGGELGTRVANLLEADERFTEIVGIDGYPPRRRTTRAEFHRIDPRDRRKAVLLVRDFDPEVILHLGVYEPNARFEPTEARLGTAASAVSVLGAAASCPSLRGIVVRSGIEVYGRRRGAPSRPDEDARIDPTTPFGRSLAHVEQVAVEAGQVAGVPVTGLRCGPIVGPSFPSPLGRFLRLPLVATPPPLAELPFCLLHQEDAAHAIVAAAGALHDGPLNVVGPGAITASQAIRRGGRIPVPVVGPGWLLAAATAELLGAPLPEHTRELLVRGGVADGAEARRVLGIEPRATDDVVAQLYEWASVAHLTPSSKGAAA
ncbi:NAD-dependent epimerase/dehydratase family protein [Aquihabitans sp. G128]|uniref:NAD-dependent epimerase/dehydratase family protein n=1 Tax=Aquihabitans sp. G128 TaxID=2849779 RepID=UPI001C24C382|nr:NAD-dependent epimerase/dehydratase family protein [Aquihabitans sp. G128]QXC59260.1 NAD-dependent epimerase/dehydratase family protein [Aquihabitans sp. G128]